MRLRFYGFAVEVCNRILVKHQVDCRFFFDSQTVKYQGMYLMGTRTVDYIIQLHAEFLSQSNLNNILCVE